ncbi:hypothetical protein E2C01_006267 [Portunus trituberculatus]|uniref:Uncharacterized protein n=1 Tax=Portunus trituberculatus TaxID=210409 RepID=A0A5B7CVV0_PORTR|nr:hypothetical protein [Portunus trituberculatus]
MDEEETQYNEEEQEENEGNEEEEEGEEEGEVDDTFECFDNPMGEHAIEKTLYDDEGNEVSFVFDKLYMVSTEREVKG